jgi:ech hydrogenase subunit D
MDPQKFIDISVDELVFRAGKYNQDGWRLVAVSGTAVPEGTELLYSFSRHEPFESLRLVVGADTVVPSISPLYFNSFVFENEIAELFGVTIEGIVIDFSGAFYDLSVPNPMNPAHSRALGAFTIRERKPAAGMDGEAVEGVRQPAARLDGTEGAEDATGGGRTVAGDGSGQAEE